jgi:predicted molibdopterin-dependent oxidoreductase YjgC
VVKLTQADRERVRIHPKDARRLGIDTGEMVDVVSRRGKVEVEAQITRSTKPGTVFMTFHFPETRTNILLSSAADPETGCPEYKVSAVRVEKQAQQVAGPA